MPKATEKWKKEKPLYKPVHSSNPKKKGMVYVKKNGQKRLIHFGDASMTDKRKGASKAQQKSYLARSAGIRTEQRTEQNNRTEQQNRTAQNSTEQN